MGDINGNFVSWLHGKHIKNQSNLDVSNFNANLTSSEKGPSLHADVSAALFKERWS